MASWEDVLADEVTATAVGLVALIRLGNDLRCDADMQQHRGLTSRSQLCF